MPTTKTITAYTLEELSPAARARAIDWYRSMIQTGEDWGADAVIDDAVEVCQRLGVTLETHPVRLRNGTDRQEPNIWYSGFSCQGDGACFEGTYQYQAPTAIRQYAPTDLVLRDIADRLLAVQARYAYSLTATIEHQDHSYYHKHTVDITVDRTDGEADTIAADDVELIEIALRDLMRWIYRQLEAAYTDQTSDMAIAETIRINDYLFTEDGRRSVVL